MTRDVFKYFKYVRSLQEATGSEKALELGYQHQARGVYIDPKTQKRYKAEGDRLVPVVDEPTAEKGGGEEKPEGKSLDQFNQDAANAAPATSALPQIPDGVSDDEFAAAKAKEFTGGRNVTPERKEFLDKVSKTLVALGNRQAASEVSDEEEPESPEEEPSSEEESETPEEESKATEEPPEKKPEDFPTLDDKIKEINVEEGKNFDGSETMGDIDIATDESINRVADISSAGVDDARFEAGRKSQKQFLDHYSKDSEYRDGLNTLSKSVAKANDRKKVNEMMDAIGSGDYLREIELKKGDKRSVSELLLGAGIDVNDEKQVQQFTKAYEEISSFIGDDGYWKRGESHELVGSNLGYYESKHISQRDDLKKLDPSGVQTKAFTTASDSGSEMAGMDPVITDAVFSILPTPSRDFLSKSGSPKTFYDPREKSGQGKPNSIRGSAALHMWAMQDGRDAYALSGQRRSPGEFQVEHITPLKSGGSDTIANFGMLLRRVNEPRADLPFDKFISQAKRKTDSIDSDISNPEIRSQFEKKYRSSSFNSAIVPKISGSVSDLIGNDVFNKVNSSLESALGKDSSKQLKVKPEEWSKYRNDVTNYLSKNGLNEGSSIKDFNSDQMNGLYDIMSENLGVDKAKLNEYMGRDLINNYDIGPRFVINKNGELERGRSGTTSSSGAILNMQNSILSDDNMSTEEKNATISRANQEHQKFKKSRAAYIDNPNDASAYETYLEDVVSNVNFLTGEGDSSLKPGRKYDTRLTYSDKNNIDNDTINGIMSVLSLDTASISGGKDAFSPGFQKTELTTRSKELMSGLRDKLINGYVATSGFSVDQIKNPNSLNKTQRKKIEPLISALENINRGIGES